MKRRMAVFDLTAEKNEMQNRIAYSCSKFRKKNYSRNFL